MPSNSRGFTRSLPFSLLAALVLACGCDSGQDGGDSAAGGSAGPSYRIAVIPKGTTHDFWNRIHAGARKAEKEIREAGEVGIEVIWQGPLKEDDTQDQIDLVNTFLSRNVSGIVLAPLDKKALVRPVRAAMDSRKPVVIFDSGLDGEPGTDFVAYVATDNYEGGVLGARRLGQVLGGKGDVILLRYQVGSESTMQRERGFLDTLAKEYPELRLISSDQYAGATEQDAFQKSQNLLARFRSEADGVFCPNESSAAGMLGALRQSGLAGKVRFVGFDASRKLIDGVRNGEIDGLVLQDPVEMSYRAVLAMVRHLSGEEVPRTVHTRLAVVTPENIDEPEMVALHSPDLSPWLTE